MFMVQQVGEGATRLEDIEPVVDSLHGVVLGLEGVQPVLRVTDGHAAGYIRYGA
jgi:hypothetical protein